MALRKRIFVVWGAAALLLGIALSSISCQLFTKPPPLSLAPPDISVQIEHFSGTPLSGATAIPVDLTLAPRDAWGITITLIALDKMPDDGLPIGAQASFVAVTRGRGSVLPTERLGAGTRLLDEAQVEKLLNPPPPPKGASSRQRLATIGQFAGALLPGVTASLTATEPLGVVDPMNGRQASRGFGILLCRPATPANAQTMVLGVMAEDLYNRPRAVEIAPEAQEAKGHAARKQSDRAGQTSEDRFDAKFVRELALLDRPAPAARSTIAIVIPIQFRHSSAKAIAAVIQLAPVSDKEAFTQAVSELRQSIAVAARQPSDTPFGSGRDSTIETSLESLGSPGSRRSALVFLAGLSNAPLCENVAMVADDATLQRISQEIAHRVKSMQALPDAKPLGWLMERTTLAILSDLMNNSKLSPELSAVLTAYAGEAGRHADSIDQISKIASSRQDLQNRLQAENLIFLEDDSPAARVRADDWLQTRGEAPAGFDPLGTPRQRSDALDKASATPGDAPASQPATQSARISAEGGQP